MTRWRGRDAVSSTALWGCDLGGSVTMRRDRGGSLAGDREEGLDGDLGWNGDCGQQR